MKSGWLEVPGDTMRMDASINGKGVIVSENFTDRKIPVIFGSIYHDRKQEMIRIENNLLFTTKNPDPCLTLTRKSLIAGDRIKPCCWSKEWAFWMLSTRRQDKQRETPVTGQVKWDRRVDFSTE
jgi:hypothetical protein